jgi:hypothetical protein
MGGILRWASPSLLSLKFVDVNYRLLEIGCPARMSLQRIGVNGTDGISLSTFRGVVQTLFTFREWCSTRSRSALDKPAIKASIFKAHPRSSSLLKLE